MIALCPRNTRNDTKLKRVKNLYPYNNHLDQFWTLTFEIWILFGICLFVIWDFLSPCVSTSQRQKIRPHSTKLLKMP